jgi:hypothetical protein
MLSLHMQRGVEMPGQQRVSDVLELLQTASDGPVGFRVDINLQAIVHAIIIPARRN